MPIADVDNGISFQTFTPRIYKAPVKDTYVSVPFYFPQSLLNYYDPKRIAIKKK